MAKVYLERFTARDTKALASDYWSLVVRHYRGAFVVAMVWILLMQIAALGEPYAMKFVIDNVLGHKAGTLSQLLGVVSVLFAVLSVGNVIQVFKNGHVLAIQLDVERDLPKTCMTKLLGLPLTFHERENTGVLIGKVIKGVGKAMDITGMMLYEILPLIIQTTVTVVIMAWIAPMALAVFLPVVVVFTALTYKLKQRLAPLRKKRHDDDSECDRFMGQAVDHVATVQSFVQEKREYERVAALRDDIHMRASKEFRYHRGFDFLRNVVINLGYVLVIVLCARLTARGELTMGSFVFVVSLADRVFKGCYRIGNIFDRVQEWYESVHKISMVLSTDEEIPVPANPIDAPARFLGGISFKDVTHVYQVRMPGEKEGRAALKDVTLDIRPGETIGIVGPSGSGKSTFAKVLKRFIVPTSGSIRIDGIDLALMDPQAFRRQIADVSQDVEIFDGTIIENITYGRTDVSREEVEAAAAIANAHDFIIEDLKDGYDTVVGKDGMRLSGGQRQRIGIARAILLDAPILLFDEATSHVDSISERKIHEAIERLRHGRTTIMIAHRLSTVQNADRIVVMERGRVLEVGSHAQLLKNQGLYQKLIRLQTADEKKM